MWKTVKYFKTAFLLLKNHVKLLIEFLLKLFILGTFDNKLTNLKNEAHARIKASHEIGMKLKVVVP